MTHDNRDTALMGHEIVLQAEGLAKRYSRRRAWALREIDLAIPRGGITALVGPNAAGKSTLIRSWIGFEKPTRGRALVCGVDAWSDRTRALEHVGYVSQSPTLYDTLSVADHLLMAQRARASFDRPGAERRLDELAVPLAAMGNELSGGQQAQVALALALSSRADVLLLDEPLASLDPLARREFLYLLTDAVRTEGTTALLSSHIVTDIEQACDHLIVLGVGRVVLDLSVADALATHAVALDDTSTAPIVGGFRDTDGSRLTVVMAAADTPNYRPATLEEVMLAHLAATRAATASERAA